MPGAGLRVGFIEPHLGRFGGIRRVLEFGNRMVDRGHEVTYFVPDDQVAAGCAWMECRGRIASIAEGRSMKEVAAVLHIAPRTVAFHKYRVMEQLNVKTTAELIQYAIKHHIV